LCYSRFHLLINITEALRVCDVDRDTLGLAGWPFRVRRSRGKMYIRHARLSVCLSVCRCMPTQYRTDPDVTCGNGRGCPLIVHYWSDLQSVHGFRCYDNTAPNAKCQRVLVLASACTRSMPGSYCNRHLSCFYLLTYLLLTRVSHPGEFYTVSQKRPTFDLL